ncbi:MAG: hypothetical protein K8S98_13120 [Planctomycetes bacterium]|nr:hypothetical protein [Planctomycetota bacterium]
MPQSFRPFVHALAVAVFVPALFAQRPGDSPPPREGGTSKPVDARPSTQKLAPIAVGAQVDPALGWVDATGKAETLGELKGKTVVVFFVGHASKATAAWAARWKRLPELYKDAGVVFVALDANADDCADATKEARGRLAKWAEEQGLGKLRFDAERNVADRLSVAANAHAVVIDAQGRFAYSGVLDDDYKGEHEARALVHVRAALDAVLAGKAPERATTAALGDPIVREFKRPSPPPEPKRTGEPKKPA